MPAKPYQVLARKYRPQTFAELVGQEHVRTTIENAITQGRIAHGYIFAGQRGTGKTTVARILARCLNCIKGPTPQPCGECASCLEIAASGAVDVIEIDAASNRGINEMRELRESVRYRPARDRYKVFIVDEAHQITSEAFNALLKTLEEPPEWVVFLLCTTEAHKIPATIGSRCQQFSFRSVDFAELITRLEWICREEGIESDTDTLALLAQVGEGSVRDSLSALDQAIACCGTKLKVDEVRSLLGIFAIDSLERVTSALVDADSGRMLDIVQELERNGHSLHQFCRELARYFRNLLVARVAGADTRLIAASAAEQAKLGAIAARFSEEDLTRYLQLTLDLFRDMQASLQPRLHLEIGLLRLVHAGKLLPIEQALAMVGQGGAKTPAPPAGSTPPPKASPRSAAPPVAASAAPSSGWKQRLNDVLAGQGLTFLADAVAHSEISEFPGELKFSTPKEYATWLKDSAVHRAVQQLAGRPMKITVLSGGPAAEAAEVAAPAPRAAEDEISRRVLADPAVQPFLQMKGSEVRSVRDLKE